MQKELLSESSLPVAWADCLLAIVDCQEKLESTKEGIETLHELISKCDQELDLKARALSRLANFQEQNQSDYKQAIRTVESLLYVAIKLKDHQTERNSYYQLGRYNIFNGEKFWLNNFRLHHKANRNEQAERCLEKAMQIDRANQQSSPELEIELARVFLELKKYQKVNLIFKIRIASKLPVQLGFNYFFRPGWSWRIVTKLSRYTSWLKLRMTPEMLKSPLICTNRFYRSSLLKLKV